MKQFFISTILILVSTITQAQTEKKIIRGYSLQAENDVFAGLLGFNNEDKDYSGGFKFEFYTDYLNNGIFPFFKNRSEDRTDADPEYLNFNSFYFHGMGFTPNRDAFDLKTPVTDQRPYASIIGFGRKRFAYFSDLDLGIETDLFLGKVGTKLPGNAQNFIHEYITNSKMVLGWENQIGNGGRWIGSYRIRSYINPLVFRKRANEDGVRLFLEPHITVGNLFMNTGIGLSFTDRRGQSKGLMTAMGSSNLTLLGEGDTYDDFLSHFDWEIFARYQRIFYNTLLMGLPFYDNSIYKVQKEEINRNLYDIGGKIIFNYYPNKTNAKSRHTSSYIEIIYRSKEFSYHKPHIFGNIGVIVFLLGNE